MSATTTKHIPFSSFLVGNRFELPARPAEGLVSTLLADAVAPSEMRQLKTWVDKNNNTSASYTMNILEAHSLMQTFSMFFAPLQQKFETHVVIGGKGQQHTAETHVPWLRAFVEENFVSVFVQTIFSVLTRLVDAGAIDQKERGKIERALKRGVLPDTSAMSGAALLMTSTALNLGFSCAKQGIIQLANLLSEPEMVSLLSSCACKHTAVTRPVVAAAEAAQRKRQHQQHRRPKSRRRTWRDKRPGCIRTDLPVLEPRQPMRRMVRRSRRLARTYSRGAHKFMNK